MNDDRAFYAALAPRYDLFYSFSGAGDRTEQDLAFLQWVLGEHVPAATRIWDVACGTGRHVIPLAQAGYQVTASDISPEMLQVARAKADEAGVSLPFLEADMRELPVDQPRADLVVCLFTAFAHMLTNADIRAALISMREALKPGGTLVIESMNFAWILDKFLPVREEVIPHPDGSGWLQRTVRPEIDTINALLRHAEYVLDVRGERVEASTYATWLRMLCWPDLQHYLHEAGFVSLELYDTTQARTPATTVAQRLLVVAKR